MEDPRTRKQPVGHQRVQVGVEVQILAEGVNGHDDAGDAFGQAQARAQKLDQALVGDAAEVFEQIAVVAEVRAEHLGDAEHEMPVRHRIEDALGQQRPEELDLLLVAGRAEPAALAGEGQQAVLLAVIAPDAGEAAGRSPHSRNFSTTSGMMGRRKP